jgi:hypothetical protein
MDKRKEQETTWKSEQIRAERRERLAKLKSKDGGKKAIKSHSVLGRVIAIILALLILIGGGGWLLYRFGIPQKSLTALTASGYKVSPAELNLVMGLHAMNMLQMGMIYTPENQAVIDEMVPNLNQTYRDILIESAADEISYNMAIRADAEANGFVLSEEDEATMNQNADSLIDSYTSYAAQSQQSLSEFLENSFGPGATITLLEDYYRDSFYVNAYVYQHYQDAHPDEEAVTAYYDENKDDFDMVDYRVVDFNAEYATDADDAAKEEAGKNAVKRAEEMLAALDSVDKFYDLALAHLENKDKIAEIERDPLSLEHRYELKNSGKSSADVKEWLFDAERKTGDKTVLETSNGAKVLWFEKRYRADVKPYNVRHILISVDRATGTDEEKKAAEDKAKEILSSYESGEKTEDAFAELARQNSEDSNAGTGGLYEDVPPGQMVSEFENWALDSVRKPGDTGIVQTQYGFHIMYFVGYGDEAVWYDSVSKRIANDETIAWSSAITADSKVEYNSIGIRFAGKSNLFSTLFGRSFTPRDDAPETAETLSE